jgi:hypothetical protein
MIPVFERAKTSHALDRAATVIGRENVKDTRCWHDAFLEFGRFNSDTFNVISV